MSAEDFKAAVQMYIELHDEITKSSRQMRELKKQKDGVGETILSWMKNNQIDECELPDGKLIRKTSKRTAALKKEQIFDEIKDALGDEAKATVVLNNLYSKRVVVETEILSRTVKRGI